MNFNVEERTILLVRHGSYAYGTNIEGSDIDVKGVCIPPVEYFLGFLNKFEQHESKDPYDSVVYALSKFAKLAADCNPNIIEVLFADRSDIIDITSWGETLLSFRDQFLSKRARHSFSGFAHSQLKRIKTHRGWLLNPPKKEPIREDFGLNSRRVVSKSELGAMIEVDSKGLTSELHPNAIELIQKEKKYARAKREWEQYQHWKKTRNPKRAETEAKFGYDTKHGCHLIRLMRMCVEIMEQGKVIVRRPDAEELISIRLGAWSYDKLIEESEKIDTRLEEIYKDSTKVPHTPNFNKLNGYIMDLHESYLGYS